MEIAYVAGPYRSDTVNGIYQNIQAARAVAAELWAIGFAVICPHMNSAFMDGIACDDTFIKGDIEIMLRCADFVVMLPGYYESEGCELEATAAIEARIPVYYYPKDIRKIKELAGG